MKAKTEKVVVLEQKTNAFGIRNEKRKHKNFFTDYSQKKLPHRLRTRSNQQRFAILDWS